MNTARLSHVSGTAFKVPMAHIVTRRLENIGPIKGIALTIRGRFNTIVKPQTANKVMSWVAAFVSKSNRLQRFFANPHIHERRELKVRVDLLGTYGVINFMEVWNQKGRESAVDLSSLGKRIFDFEEIKTDFVPPRSRVVTRPKVAGKVTSTPGMPAPLASSLTRIVRVVKGKSGPSSHQPEVVTLASLEKRAEIIRSQESFYQHPERVLLSQTLESVLRSRELISLNNVERLLSIYEYAVDARVQAFKRVKNLIGALKEIMKRDVFWGKVISKVEDIYSSFFLPQSLRPVDLHWGIDELIRILNKREESDGDQQSTVVFLEDLESSVKVLRENQHH